MVTGNIHGHANNGSRLRIIGNRTTNERKLEVSHTRKRVCKLEEVAKVSAEDEDDAHIRNIYDQVDLVVSVEDLGRLKSSMHGIETDRSELIRQGLSSQPLTMIPAIDQHLDKMLKQGLIELSRSEWASNVVKVKKKDGYLCFCVDYWKVNAVTIKYVGLLPWIDACLHILAGSQRFSTFGSAGTASPGEIASKRCPQNDVCNEERLLSSSFVLLLEEVSNIIFIACLSANV